MSNIVIGSDPQPNSADIVIDDDGPGATEIKFEIPRLPKGTLLLAFIVRNADAVTAPAGWGKKIDGVGGAGLFLDGFARMLDDSDMRGEDEDLASALFLSVAGQELQGHLAILDNTAPSYGVEATASASFAADATPPTPGLKSQQANNRIFVIYSGSGAVDFGAPATFTVDDEYTSNEVTQRTFFIASKEGKQTGTLAFGDGAANPAATGRAWTVVVRNNPPLIPRELADVVPGHIGLIGVG